MVGEVNCFGEWGGRTVIPHPHAHSTHDFVVHPLTQTRLPLHEFLKHPDTSISRPLHCRAFSRRGLISRFFLSSRTELSGFYPCSFFPRGSADDVVVSTPHRLIVGSALLLTLIHRLGDCNFFHSMVCICFLGDLVPRTGCVFPRCWLWLLWSSLHVGDCGKFA